MVEHSLCMRGAAGSMPATSTFFSYSCILFLFWFMFFSFFICLLFIYFHCSLSSVVCFVHLFNLLIYLFIFYLFIYLLIHLFIYLSSILFLLFFSFLSSFSQTVSSLPPFLSFRNLCQYSWLSIFACHVKDRGSNPRQRVHFFLLIDF